MAKKTTKHRARCWSCGKAADRKLDYCYGCEHVVCDACFLRYEHGGWGLKHGRKHRRHA